MPFFRPTRASSPAKSSTADFASSVGTTVTRASIASTSATATGQVLQGLTPDEVEVLDAVIERAGPEATTFKTVFKAYNDIFFERGLDTHETVFYGRLLKIGTLKGRNWLDKWEAVKEQCGYTENPEFVPQYHQLTGNSLGLEITDDYTETNSTPPSYRTTPRVIPQPAAPPPSNDSSAAAKARRDIALARERVLRAGSVVNEDDAWKKIKMQRDEEDADRFRDDRLVERCWQVWLQGVQWIATTNGQIDQARDNLLLRQTLSQWREKLATQRALHARVESLANTRLLRTTLRIWKFRAKQRKAAQWRTEMRSKMKIVRTNRENALRKDMWGRWIAAMKVRGAEARYERSLLIRVLGKWRDKLWEVDQLEGAAEEFARLSDERKVDEAWKVWTKAMRLRDTERIVAERVGLRILGNVMDVWTKHGRENHVADAFYRRTVLKRTIRSWIAAQTRLRHMETRAVRYVSRQDALLVHAVMRVWKARERGRLLERFRAKQLVKDVWVAWRDRVDKHRVLEAKAIEFSNRPTSHTLTAALSVWRTAHTTQLTSLSFAQQYADSRLLYNTLLNWRIHLRDVIALGKKARKAQSRLVLRNAWDTWKERVEQRRREGRLREMERERLRRAFTAWLLKAHGQRSRRLAEETMKKRVTSRILTTALHRWINRVIVLKDRELDVLPRHEKVIVTAAFKKWKSVCIRHVEVLNLMESYQYVKREEQLRRLFYRWLSASRSTRRRRITLQEREDEVKLGTLSVAWDKWRDRFNDEKLRPAEYTVVMQSQKNLVFKSFGVWHSKTKTLPAIRFHASLKKAQAWAKWRSAMPRALQTREARTLERKHVLAKFLERWVQSYRKKTVSKAVARARYLRLPTATPRRLAPSRPFPAPRDAPSIFPRRTAKPDEVSSRASSPSSSDTHSEAPLAGPSRLRQQPYKPPSTPAAVIPSRPFGERANIASLMVPRARSEINSTPRSRLTSPRDPSPARSRISAGTPLVERGRLAAPPARPASSPGEVGRSRLWLELRGVQRKSQTPTERSRTRE